MPTNTSSCRVRTLHICVAIATHSLHTAYCTVAQIATTTPQPTIAPCRARWRGPLIPLGPPRSWMHIEAPKIIARPSSDGDKMHSMQLAATTHLLE
jgi:hypothetical protein